MFDWADTIPGSLLPQIKSQASDRYSKKVMNSTYYIFLNTKTKPFSSQLAREAVIIGLDQNAMSRLGSGTLIPGCYFLPPGMIGHPTGAVPVRRSGQRRRHRQGQAARPAVGHGRHAGDGLERDALAAPAVDDVLHRSS